MPISNLADLMHKGGIIYDCWNMHESQNLSLPESVDYVALGGHK